MGWSVQRLVTCAAIEHSLDGSDLQRALGELHRAVRPAHSALLDVRRDVERCWPRKPSKRVLDRESYELYTGTMHLVALPEGGGLTNLIEAAKETLQAHGVEPPLALEGGVWEWERTRVDREAEARPDPTAAATLRAALPGAETWHHELCRLLNAVDRLAPPEAWLPAWTIDDARAYIALVKWKFARTMPLSPHWYTVRGKRPELAPQFLAFAQLIQAQGVLKTWGGHVRAYLEVDGFEYWTMGARVPETIIINRADSGGARAAQPIPAVADARLRPDVERSLAYRRIGASTDGIGGILGGRLRSLLSEGPA